MAITVASLEAILSLSKDKFDQGLRDTKSALGGLGDLAVKAGIGLGAGIATGTAAAAVAAFDMSKDIDQSTKNVAASLGISEEAAGEFKDEMKDIFAAGFGKDFDEIGQAVALVSKSIDGIDDKSLKDLAQGALALEDNFDKDVNETVDAAAVLMKKFGLSGKQALDFITKGLQSGLDRNEDFLDSIREYGNLFDDAGFDADQFFSIMETGAAGGVLGTDKISDAIKEFQIRANEGTDDVRDAFTEMGLDFDKISRSIATGDETWADYFNNVVSGLGSIEDPLERNRVQVALFGTQAEDLGVSFTQGLSTASTTLDDMAGATDSLNVKYDNLGDAVAGFGRRGILALTPMSDAVLDLVNDNLPALDEFFTNKLLPTLEKVSAGGVAFGTEFGGILVDELAPSADRIEASFTRINEVLSGTGEGFGDVAQAAETLNEFLVPVTGTIDLASRGLEAAAAGLEKLHPSLEGVNFSLADTVALGAEFLNWLNPVTFAIKETQFVLENWGTALDFVSDKLAGLKVPDWLKPGSPPPLANAIADISGELKSMPDLASAFNVGATGASVSAPAIVADQAAAGGGGRTVIVNFNGTVYDADGVKRAIGEAMTELTMALSGA